MKKRSVRPPNNDDDDDDYDHDDKGGGSGVDADSFDSMSEEIVPHSALLTSSAPAKFAKTASFAPAGAPLSTEMIMEVPQLKEKRKKEGILPDDGSRRREDVYDDILPTDTDAVKAHKRSLMALYGREWLDEAVARQRMLDSNPHYRFAFTVAGGHNSVLKTFIKESDISREARDRVGKATAALVERRRGQQDTSGEQARAKSLRADIEKLQTERQDITNNWRSLEFARTCLKQALTRIADPLRIRLKYAMVYTAAQFYEEMFDKVTRSLVARFGTRGYEFGADLFKTVLQEFNLDSLQRLTTDQPTVDRIKNDMPNSSLLALYWTTLLAIYNNASLLDTIAKEVGERKLFPPKSAYGLEPQLYAKDLRSLAVIVFTAAAATPATSNLLLFDEITVYMWRMINLMIERSVEDKKDAKTLARPTALAGSRPPRSRTIIVNNIEITLDVADEDLVSSISGQEVFGVDRDKLAEMRAKPYNNIDQPRTAALMTALLEPMFVSVWNSLFYTKRARSDDGLDDEAFAGGYYDNGRVVDLFQPTPGTSSAQRSIIGLAIVAIEMFNSCLTKKQAVAAGIPFDGIIFAATALTRFDTANPDLKAPFRTKFATRFDVSADSVKRYENDILGRYLRREKVLACLAQAVLIKRRFGFTQGVSESDFAALQAYVSDVNTNTPGARNKSEFAVREDAAMRVFDTVTATTAVDDVNEDDPPFINPAAVGILTDSQSVFVEDALANSAASVYGVELLRRIDERLATLSEQERLLNERISQWLRTSLADEQGALQQIIMYGAGGSTENALSPINTGFLFFTELYTNALKDAFKWIEDYLPCLARQFSSDDLVESEYYQSRYSSLVQSQLRLIDAQVPHVWRANRTEMRSKMQIASAGDSLRRWVAADRGIQHVPGCDCGANAGSAQSLAVHGQYRLVEQMQPYPMVAYPLAPSLNIPRGAF
jgi:hypothetical protein